MNDPSIEELVEALERTDAGNRLAFPALFDHSEPEEAGEMSRGDGLGGDGPERLISAFAQQIDVAETILGILGARVEEHSLAAAVVGRSGIKLGELREQLPALREALSDGGGS